MSDLISRNALLADIEATIENSGCVNHEGEILDCIAYADEIDAVPVVRGEWVLLGMRPVGTKMTHYCSACAGHGNIDMKYCPNCGAKMSGGADNGTA